MPTLAAELPGRGTASQDDASPVLSLRGVDAAYGNVQILHGVSLDLFAGEVVSIIGPNGAGK
ncbi:MAG: hypothetical protein M3P94_07040, partial [Chloroflexota bacterium]|nr:hypothetical protein [Chloroflexota bacterium]